ncbi:MAG: TfoX/Sxy family protein [Candidatus Omnitrophica bacterium]|nr:TfoX/Sxy family protein [Candidatus Omnitrophota bacterium]
MAQTKQIRNIGPVSREWLNAVGIRDINDLKRLGAVEVYCRVRERGFAPTLNLLWALEAAIQDAPWYSLTADDKECLRTEVEQRAKATLKNAHLINKNKSQKGK